MMSLSTDICTSPSRTGPQFTRWRQFSALALLLLCAPLWAAPTDMILVLDNSGSMRQNDPAFLLKGAVTKFFAQLPADTHAGVVIFDDKVSYPVPLAPVDAAAQSAVQSSLTKVDYRGQFTNIPAAMERAIYELKSSARKDATKVVVFMTDGIVDTGNAAVDAEKAKWLREELASDAADSGVRIFGIAFTENADFFLIQSLAKKTSGEYFRALKPEDLDGVFVKVQDKLNGMAAPAPAPVVTPPATVAPPAIDVAPASCAGGGECRRLSGGNAGGRSYGHRRNGQGCGHHTRTTVPRNEKHTGRSAAGDAGTRCGAERAQRAAGNADRGCRQGQ